MFPDGSVWVDAMNLDADMARVCGRFGHDGAHRPTPTEAAKFLGGVLEHKRVLVVVDNVPDASIDPRRLPLVGGMSRTVLTTRAVALHMSLDRPARKLRLGRWSKDACRAYLTAVAEEHVGAAATELDALSAFVDHLPLGVKLVARLLARPGTMPARLLTRLEHEPLGILDRFAIGADRGVAATFAASYEGLDDSQRRVFIVLAACARVTKESVVAGVVGLADDVVGDILADLAERSLIDPVETLRWTMHDVVRLFVRTQPGVRQADEAHLAFAEAHVEAHQDPRDWQAMDAGTDEVLAAVDRLLSENDEERAWRLLARTDEHLMQRGRHGELVARCEELVKRLPESSEELALVLGKLGLCCRILGDIPAAQMHHQRSLALHEKHDRRMGQASALSNLGACYREQGDIRTAIEHLGRSLAIAEKLEWLDGQATALGRLGACYRNLGDIPTAIAHYQRSLALNEILERLEAQATDLRALGRCYQALGELPRAIELLERSLDLHNELGVPAGQAMALSSLGACYEQQGKLSDALDFYQRALALYRRIALPDDHHEVRPTLAAIARLTAVSS